MKKLVLVIGLVLFLGLGATKRAEACGSGGGDWGTVIGAVLVVGGTYAGVTGGMAIHDLASDRSSTTYGVVETLWNAPFALAWGSAMVDEIQNEGDHQFGYTMMTGLHVALAAHGIYTIVQRARESDAPPPATFNVGSVRATVAPTPIAGGGGLGLAGSF